MPHHLVPWEPPGSHWLNARYMGWRESNTDSTVTRKKRENRSEKEKKMCKKKKNLKYGDDHWDVLTVLDCSFCRVLRVERMTEPPCRISYTLYTPQRIGETLVGLDSFIFEQCWDHALHLLLFYSIHCHRDVIMCGDYVTLWSVDVDVHVDLISLQVYRVMSMLKFYRLNC